MAATRVHVAAEAMDPIGAQVGFVEGPWFELLGVRALRGRRPAHWLPSRRSRAWVPSAAWPGWIRRAC